MQLFYQPKISNEIQFLPEKESIHCIKVLRKKLGDKIDIIDGKGCYYKVIITNADPKKCEFEIISSSKEKSRNFLIHIAIAPTKNMDRIEWFIEKSVEFGIDKISLISCSHSERNKITLARLNKKAIAAAKQSGRASVPEIVPVTAFTAFMNHTLDYDSKYIGYVDHSKPIALWKEAKPGASYCVLIGPEGDFSNEELSLAENRGFLKINLGPGRLRTETAGIAACYILNLVNQ